MPPRNRIIRTDEVAKPEVPAEIPSPVVRVRARVHLAESIGGQIHRFAPGEILELPEARVLALGALVGPA